MRGDTHQSSHKLLLLSPSAGSHARGSWLSTPNFPISDRTFSRPSAGASPKTEPNATISPPSPSRPSSRRTATPAPSTGRRDGPASQAHRDENDSTDTQSAPDQKNYIRLHPLRKKSKKEPSAVEAGAPSRHPGADASSTTRALQDAQILE